MILLLNRKVNFVLELKLWMRRLQSAYCVLNHSRSLKEQKQEVWKNLPEKPTSWAESIRRVSRNPEVLLAVSSLGSLSCQCTITFPRHKLKSSYKMYLNIRDLTATTKKGISYLFLFTGLYLQTSNISSGSSLMMSILFYRFVSLDTGNYYRENNPKLNTVLFYNNSCQLECEQLFFQKIPPCACLFQSDLLRHARQQTLRGLCEDENKWI